MASSKDGLDVLQLMVNDVLVQTGKALRASRKDGKGNPSQAHGNVQSKLPDTLRTFHSTLDKLETDIVRAKSALLRDLNQLQARKLPAEQPQQVEAQSKSPMVIDLDSSPPAIVDEPIPVKVEAESKPMAPFPDMGTGLPDALQPDVVMKDETTPSQYDLTVDSGFSFKPETSASATPGDLVSMKQTASSSGVSGPDAVLGIPAPGSNFTDMQFDLAPSNDDPQSQQTTQEPSFDITTFAPAGGNDDMLDLDSFLPTSLDEQTSQPVTTSQGASNEAQDKAEKPAEGTDSAFTDLYNPDGSPADGMDFDFGLDGAMGEETFNDLIQDRDDTYDTMEHGEFDATYFGLDTSNDT